MIRGRQVKPFVYALRRYLERKPAYAGHHVMANTQLLGKILDSAKVLDSRFSKRPIKTNPCIEYGSRMSIRKSPESIHHDVFAGACSKEERRRQPASPPLWALIADFLTINARYLMLVINTISGLLLC